MSEREFQRLFVDLATRCRWLHYHTYNSQRSNPGFPDLTLVRGRRVLFVELKTNTGRLSGDQRTWLSALNDSVAEAYVLRPKHWPEIQKLLSVRAIEPFQREIGDPIPVNNLGTR